MSVYLRDLKMCWPPSRLAAITSPNGVSLTACKVWMSLTGGQIPTSFTMPLGSAVWFPMYFEDTSVLGEFALTTKARPQSTLPDLSALYRGNAHAEYCTRTL